MATLADLLKADLVTITLDNQQNGQQNAALQQPSQWQLNDSCECASATRTMPTPS
jgi:hypothetical protein